MKLSEIRARMKTLIVESKGLLSKHPDFDFGDDTDRITQIETELLDLKGKLDDAKKHQDMADRLSAFNSFMDEPDSAPSFGGAPNDGDGTKARGGGDGAQQGQEAAKALSSFVLGNAEYTDWLKKAAPHGYFGEKVKIESPQIQIPGGIKALVTGTSDASAGAFIESMRNPYLPLLRRPLTMRDIVSIARTQSDAIEYVRQVSETNNAAMVPEATSSAVIDGSTVTAAMGGLKPESGMVFEKILTNVKTVAHWMPATKRALADAGQMQNLIDDFLRWGLEEELEDQMVLGNGTGENFEGLTNITNLTAQPWDTNLLVTSRRAKTKVRTVGRMSPTAYLLNPYDWENIQLTRADAAGTEGPFLFGGPAANEVPTLWNLPVVESESVPQGTGYVGNFKTLVLWDREQANVQVTDSHADFFVRNLVAILAEARAAFGCLRPAAIVEMDLTAA
jgi:HK97 family phage major capsid protein